MLTHWGRVTHICVSKIIIIASDNGLSPGRRQAIIWTNARILLIEHLGTNFGEIVIEIHIFSFKKMHLKMSSAKWRLFGLGLNELNLYFRALDWTTAIPGQSCNSPRLTEFTGEIYSCGVLARSHRIYLSCACPRAIHLSGRSSIAIIGIYIKQITADLSIPPPMPGHVDRKGMMEGFNQVRAFCQHPGML